MGLTYLPLIIYLETVSVCRFLIWANMTYGFFGEPEIVLRGSGYLVTGYM